MAGQHLQYSRRLQLTSGYTLGLGFINPTQLHLRTTLAIASLTGEVRVRVRVREAEPYPLAFSPSPSSQTRLAITAQQQHTVKYYQLLGSYVTADARTWVRVRNPYPTSVTRLSLSLATLATGSLTVKVRVRVREARARRQTQTLDPDASQRPVISVQLPVFVVNIGMRYYRESRARAYQYSILRIQFRRVICVSIGVGILDIRYQETYYDRLQVPVCRIKLATEKRRWEKQRAKR